MSETLEETVDTDVDTTSGAEATTEVESSGAVETPDGVVDAPASSHEIDWNVDALRTAAAHLERLGFTISAAQVAVAEQTQEIPTPDPFADDYAEQLERYNQAQLDKELAPFREFFARQQEAQTEGAIGGLLAHVAQEAKLELSEEDQPAFRALADAFAPAAASRYPFNGQQAAHFAAQQAAQWIKTRDAAQAAAGVEAYKRGLGGVTDPEPGVTGGGVEIEPQPKTYDEIIAKHVERLRG